MSPALFASYHRPPTMNQHEARSSRLKQRITGQRALFEQWSVEHRKSDPEFVARLRSLLLFVDGLRNHEIAEETGLSENAIRRVRRRFELWGPNCIKDPCPQTTRAESPRTKPLSCHATSLSLLPR